MRETERRTKTEEIGMEKRNETKIKVKYKPIEKWREMGEKA